MNAPLHILFASNDRYAMHMGVAIASICATRHPATALVFHILEQEISPANKRRLARVIAPHRAAVSLTYIVPTPHALETLPIRHHYALPMYYRYWLHLFLPPSVPRILYLDCDMIVCGDLAALYGTDLGGRPMGAVADKYASQQTPKIPGWPPGDAPYYNTGMLVIDVPAWRASGLAEAMLATIRQHGAQLDIPDQDGFNLVARNAVQPLPPCWNYQIVMTPDHDPPCEPRIVHYIGSIKPWNLWHAHPLRRHYTTVRRRTPWRLHPIELGQARHAWPGLVLRGGLLLPEWLKRPLRRPLRIPLPESFLDDTPS